MPMHNAQVESNSSGRRRPRPLHLAACLATALGLGGLVTPAIAANIVVRACSDDDIFHPPLILFGLRSSVAVANDGDTIDLTKLGTCTITLTNGAIPVTVNNLEFVGPTSQIVTIDGQSSDRVFNHTGTGGILFENLTIAHGKTAGNGGCIQSTGTVDLFVNVVVTGCSAGGKGGGIAAPYVQANHSTISHNVGGGIYASGTRTSAPDAYLENSTISGNTGGAGLAANKAGYTYILTSTIANNTSTTCGGIDAGSGSNTGSIVDMRFSSVTGNNAGNGSSSVAGGICGGTISLYHASVSDNAGGTGGVASYGKAAAVNFYGFTANRSTIADNTGYSRSGGVLSNSAYIFDSTISGNTSAASGVFTIFYGAAGIHTATGKFTNSTVSGNRGQTEGGIVASQATIFNSTIAFNTTYTTGDQYGGGIVIGGFGCARATCSYNLSLYSTIVANNIVVGIPKRESDVQLLGTGVSLNASSSLIMASNRANSSITADPQLLALASNGGPVQTHALSPHSPAIGKGGNQLTLDFDERGSGFSRSWVNGQTDIGAYQTQDRIFYNGFQ